MARLPVVKDAAGNAHQTIMMQLEYGEQADGRNKKGEGGIIWKGYDGLIVPVPAGEPRSQPKPWHRPADDVHCGGWRTLTGAALRLLILTCN